MASNPSALTSIALAAIGLAFAAGVALHLLPASRVLDPISSTMSEYALMPDGWLFDAGVLLLSVGSAVAGVALARAGLLLRRSPAAISLLVWCSALVALIVFHKERLGIDTSLQARVHWIATLTAFVSLPLTVALLCGPHFRHCGPWPRTSVLAAGTATVALAVIGVQTVMAGLLSIQVWPIAGIVERVLVGAEMASVVCLAGWARCGCRCAEGRR